MSTELTAPIPSALSIGEPCVWAGITAGQQILLDLLRDCYGTGTPITRELVRRAYFKARPKQAAVLRNASLWNGKYGAECVHQYVQLRTDDPRVKDQADWGAMNWFRQNLGACIMKGKLIAIPVIDI